MCAVSNLEKIKVPSFTFAQQMVTGVVLWSAAPVCRLPVWLLHGPLELLEAFFFFIPKIIVRLFVLLVLASNCRSSWMSRQQVTRPQWAIFSPICIFSRVHPTLIYRHDAS